MAGDWIKMRADLQTHPKVVRIASALRADRLRVVGGLHAVWCLFDAHSIDGFLHGYTPESLDSLIGFDGFTRAMESVEWVEVNGDALSLPRFTEHNGQSAKRRASDAQRKRDDRKPSADRPQRVRKMSASGADKKRTREEKRREEKREPVFPSSTQVLGVADSEAKLVIKNPELPEDGLAAIDIIDRTWSIVVPSADPLDEFTVAKWLQLRHHHPWCIAAAICEAEGKLREVVRPDGYLRGIVEAREDWPCDTAQDFVTYSLDPARRAKLSIVVGGVA